jgi:hypothetical protein
MTRRRAVIGTSLLCALALCAFAAPDAGAVKGTTAYTCEAVEQAAAFEDEHCTKDAEGGEGFIHEEIPEDVVTDVTVTNTQTGKEQVPAKLKTVIAGVEVEVEAGGFHSCVGETNVVNVEEKEKMFAGGLYCGEYSKVVVKKPANCSVPGGVVKLNEGFWETRVLEKEMWIEFRPAGAEPFAQFELVGALCPLKGVKVEVKGVADANPMQKELPLDGATLKFKTTETENNLKVGAQKAKFEGSFTPFSADEQENPVIVTTTDH